MTSKIKKWIIAVAIAIVFNLFVNYGVATFHPGPEYDDYCKESARVLPLREPSECTAINVSEEMQDQCNEQKGYIAYKYDSYGCATESYCETCGVEYREVREVYDGQIFVVLTIVAVIALVAGVLIKVETVSTGFLLAGVLGFIIASMRYWQHLQNVFRFLLLGVALAVLIWLGYKKVK